MNAWDLSYRPKQQTTTCCPRVDYATVAAAAARTSIATTIANLLPQPLELVTAATCTSAPFSPPPLPTKTTQLATSLINSTTTKSTPIPITTNPSAASTSYPSSSSSSSFSSLSPPLDASDASTTVSPGGCDGSGDNDDDEDLAVTRTGINLPGNDRKARKRDQNRRAAYNYRRKKMEEKNRLREEEMRLVYSRVCLIGYAERLENSILYILNTKTRKISDKTGQTLRLVCPVCLVSCDNILDLRNHLNGEHYSEYSY